LASQGEFKNALDYLETAVKPDSFLVNGKLSAADYAVFGGLFASGQWQVTAN
jgi:glutathione S-transferase